MISKKNWQIKKQFLQMISLKSILLLIKSNPQDNQIKTKLNSMKGQTAISSDDLFGSNTTNGRMMY